MTPFIRRPASRALSFCVATLTILLSAATAVLDTREGFHGPAFESEHKAGVCQSHDHTICTQLNTRHVLAAAAPRPDDAPAAPSEPAAPEERGAPARVSHAPTQSRAPPA